MSSNIEVKLDVLNQKGSPALFADSLASRPAASFAGRLFVDTDNPSTGIYRDTGTTWVQVADETGTIPTPTLQTVTTAGNTSNVGISVTANGIGIGTTIPASNRLDIHTASGINATFNGTGTTNSALQLQSAGVGKWTIQNNYNAAANDFVLTDVASSVNRLTIKNTGLATYIGYLNVSNIASSQNIQISGTAPAYTIIDVAGSGYAASLGMATVPNNFIQGSVLGDLCLVSQNTISGNLKLGVGSLNVAALNITPANRVGIGTSVDAGFKLDVNGTARIGANLSNNDILGNLNFQNSSNAAYIMQNNSTGRSLQIPGTGGNSDWIFNNQSTNFGLRGVFFDGTFRITGDVMYMTNGGYSLNYPIIGVKGTQAANNRNIYIGHTLVYAADEKGSNVRLLASPGGTTGGDKVGGDVFLTPGLGGGAARAGYVILANDGTSTIGNVGVGTATPNASSLLDITSTIRGFLPPRMTTAQKTAIATPATGLVVYDTTLNKLALYTGAAWETVTSV
jgi:hypothetical protein